MKISSLKQKILSLFSIVILGVFALGSLDDDPNAWKGKKDPIGAYIMMEEFVKKQLKAPASAEFPDYSKAFVKEAENHKYEIQSYVDAQNSFGALIRTKYIGEIEQVDDKNWQLNSLHLLE